MREIAKPASAIRASKNIVPNVPRNHDHDTVMPVGVRNAAMRKNAPANRVIVFATVTLQLESVCVGDMASDG